MHQPMCINHLPEDVSMSNPIVDKPFFNWLCFHPATPTVFHIALVQYLVGSLYQTPMLWGEFSPTNRLEAYKYTFEHFWHARLKWTDDVKERNLHPCQVMAMVPIPNAPKPIAASEGFLSVIGPEGICRLPL